jgi:hypothetical protein
MNFKQFQEQIVKAKAGRPFCYHSGLLMRTRINRPDVDKIGKVAFALHMLDRVLLFQQRVNEYSCDYLMVPRRPLRQRDIDEAIALTPIL